MGKNCFSSRIGYVLAAAGSAVGLGNIWRFPYLTAKYGGGIFLLTYLILILTFGYSLLIAENCLGRMTGKGPIGAFRDLCAGKDSFLGKVSIGGWLNSIAPVIIVPYYCVIGGWVIKYCVAMLTTPISQFHKDATIMVDGVLKDASTTYFTQFITSTWEPILYFLLFAAILIAVVAMGVEKGIERFNKILMPLLVVMCVGICIYCCFLPNAGEGLRYYLLPDKSQFSYMTVVAAMGQLFFSLSIAMGIMVTYGSYFRDDHNLMKSVNQIEFFDTLVAFLAGVMIIPAVFVFLGEEGMRSSGPGLMFEALPRVFAEMGSIGNAVGCMFFVMVLLAALTSAMSLMEAVVASLIDAFGWTRSRATVFEAAVAAAMGAVICFGYNFLYFEAVLPNGSKAQILDILDYLSNNILMPLLAIGTCILIGWIIKPKTVIDEVTKNGERFGRRGLYVVMIRFIAPVLLFVLLRGSVGVFK